MEAETTETSYKRNGATDGRVVVLIDMDCFYCQVEEALQPELRGKPLAVVQYNPWKGGGIIAVNYAARARGVTRHMRGNDARAKCPDIQLCSVPCVRGKADTTRYRDAGQRVARVLQRFTPLLERASVDEAYLDITQPVEERMNTGVDWEEVSQCSDTFAVGYSHWAELVNEVRDNTTSDAQNARALLVGALIVRDIRTAVLRETGYECSAGVAHNKMLAKVVCGLNKPNKQTVLPAMGLQELFATLPLRSLRHLGGKFGERVCRELGVTTVADLQSHSRAALQARFHSKNGSWLYAVARGEDDEPVRTRLSSQSIGCCKKFAGAAALVRARDMLRWLRDLATEIEERLQRDALDNDRTPRNMVVSFTYGGAGGDVCASRSHALPAHDVDAEMIYSLAARLIAGTLVYEEDGELPMRIKFLGISVGKFEEKTKNKKIVDFFTSRSSYQTDDSGIPITREHAPKIPAESEKKTIVDFFTSRSSYQTDGSIQNEEIPISREHNPKIIADCESKENIQENTEDTDKDTDASCIDTNIGNEINASYLNVVHTALEPEKSASLLNNVLKCDPQNANGENDDTCNEGGVASDTTDTTCPQCGERLPAHQLQTHLDFHLALRLREQDRQERRSESERRPCAPTPGVSIESYLMRASTATNACAECGHEVPPESVVEHRDMHLARRLSTQLNRRPLVSSTAKRKQIESPANKPKKPRVTLHTFFR